MPSIDSFNTRHDLSVGRKKYAYYSLPAAEEAGLAGISRLPRSMKVLLENLLRNEDGVSVTQDDLKAVAAWVENKGSVEHEIAFRPARVLMQDFTGVPAVVDLAAMRDAMSALGADAAKINPLVPVDLVIDHSVMVDHFGTPKAFGQNVEREYERNIERYNFLRWGSSAFNNFRVVPPGTGICHQVNLENLAQTVWTLEEGKKTVAYPDTVVGTDSHTTMINGLAVLGWGVGGIEAEAAMLGQPIPMLIPEVIGFKLTGRLPEGTTATDLVLTVTQMLRKKGVVGKFVEFFGDALPNMTIEDQATIANMAPEYGATCGFFPVSAATIGYLTATGRDKARVALVEAYAKAQGLWIDETSEDPVFTDVLELDLATVVPSLAGPKRPQDRVELTKAAPAFETALTEVFNRPADAPRAAVEGEGFTVGDGDVVIAAITSCTNTSNPSVLLAAGLLAKKAVEAGLKVKPHIKTSLAPGSRIVTEYLTQTGLLPYLEKLGFALAGYGCTTCIGNAGDLTPELNEVITSNDLVCAAVLSGNRNFEARIHPNLKANFLASPPLVVAYAIAGTVLKDLMTEPVGKGKGGKDIYLGDIWPSSDEVHALLKYAMNGKAFRENYSKVASDPGKLWEKIKGVSGTAYTWPASTYIAEPPFFAQFALDQGAAAASAVHGARIMALFGDSITTDHISPAGSIKESSPAGQWLLQHGVQKADFNSYGARRGNHDVMVRGTFANVRIKNLMIPPTADGSREEGGVTVFQNEGALQGEKMFIFDAAMQYMAQGTPTVIFAGEEYGTGSSRDWAAKGTQLLGIKAVVARSFERIHRSNLVGMGVLPLQFKAGDSWETLGLTGNEVIDVVPDAALTPQSDARLVIHRADGTRQEVTATLRIDTPIEVDYYQAGGILPFVLRQLLEG